MGDYHDCYDVPDDGYPPRGYDREDEADYYSEEGGAGYCAACGEPCERARVDYGRGYSEYGSHATVDRDEQIVSECCEAEIWTKDQILNREG